MQLASERFAEVPPAPLSVALAARPARVLVLVPLVEDVPWQSAFNHALTAQSRFWGGVGNIVMPLTADISENELFWELADRCDCDLIGLHAAALADLEELAPARYEEWRAQIEDDLTAQEVDPEAIIQFVANAHERPLFQVGLPEELQRLLVRRLSPFHFEEHPEQVWIDGISAPSWPCTDVAELRGLPASVTNVATALGATERLLLTVEIGRLSSGFTAVLDARGIVIEEVVSDERADWADNLYAPRRNAVLPWALSALGLSWYRRGPVDRGIVPLVIGDDPWDFALFYALRRWRQLAFWLPLSLEGDQLFLFALRRAVSDYARTMGGGRISVISVTAADRRADVVAGLGDAAGGLEIDVGDWRDVLPEHPVRLLETDRPGRFQPVLFHDGVTPPLETPIPRSIASESAEEIRWVCDLSVDGWVPIRNSSLATCLLRAPMHGSGQTRIARDGFAYLGQRVLTMTGEGLEAIAARPTLHPLTLLEQLRAVLPGGWHCQPSDKGIFATEAMRLYGGFERFCGVLRQAAPRTVFAAFEPASTIGLPLKDGRRYLTLADLETEMPADAVTSDVLAELEDAGALTRGLALKCVTCRWTAWYALGDISQTFHCQRCHRDQPVTRDAWLGTAEPVWRYGLAEVVYQFFDHHGELPMLAVFDAFPDDRPLDATFELEIVSADGVQSEVDVAVSSGSELWIGEATTSDGFNPRGTEMARLRRLREIAEAAGADGALLATSAAAFRPLTRERAGTVFADARPKLRVIERVDTAG